MRLFIAILVALTAALPPAHAAEEIHPTAVDIALLKTLGGIAIAPDGSRIAYAVTTPKLDPEAKPKGDDDTSGGWESRTRIVLVPAAGGTPRPMTSDGADASSPVFVPDGSSLAFLRKVDGTTRIHVLPLGGGEPSVVDTGDLAPGDFEFSPDGSTIAFLAERPRTDDEKAAAFRNGGARRWGRDWRPTRLWTVPTAGGTPVEALAGADHVVAFRWSPDGKRFALVLAASSDPYEASNRPWVAIAPSSGPGGPRQVSSEPANLGAIAWSPDGRLLAWEQGVGTLSLLNHLVVVETDGPGRWNAAAGLDPTLAGFVWKADSKTLVAHVQERTRSRLVELAFDGSRSKALAFDPAPGSPERVIASALAADRSGRTLVFSSSTYREPANPTIYDVTSGTLRVLADLHPQAARWPAGRLEVVTWKGPEGTPLEGVLLTSPDARAGEPAPLLVLPHGGPDAVTTEGFSAWTAYFAARGYSVFRPNYRGGTGYGFAFYAANRGRLGAIEFMDIESGVDALIASGKADPARLFYGGWSWGGYLTAWTIGHATRYRAAVAGAAVVDTVFQYVTSDINHGAAAAWEFKGDPWRQLDAFDRANPLRSLGNVVTPTLVLHGEADDRVPFANGRILWRALVDQGVPTEFWAYPREPHGFTEKAHVVHMLERWTEWLRRHDPVALDARPAK